MNKTEKSFLEKVLQCCNKLEKKKGITEFAKGQQHLAKLLLSM